MWHRKLLAALQSAQQKTCFQSGALRKWGRFDFAMKPGQRFVIQVHSLHGALVKKHLTKMSCFFRQMGYFSNGLQQISTPA
jgi:hypothetical protein